MKANSLILLAQQLLKQGWTLCSCESCTGGLFAASMTEIPGVSAFFKGGLVTYWTAMKTTLAGVDEQLIRRYGVVSEQTARAMAEGCAAVMQCDVCVSFTGNAGPAVLEGKPAGMICTAVRLPDQCLTWTDQLSGDRNAVRREIVELTAQRCLQMIENAQREARENSVQDV